MIQPAPQPWGSKNSDRLAYDGSGRMIAKRYTTGTVAGEDFNVVVGFTTEYDRSSNKFFERELHAESRSQL